MRVRKRGRSARPDVEAALRRATDLLPPDGDIAKLTSAIGDSRDRPIRVIEIPVPTDSPSGAWIAASDADYVVVDAASTPSRRAAIVCHELAHILLGHQGEALAELQLDLLAPTLNPGVAARFMGRHGYDSAAEHDAELLGTKLVAAAEKARLNLGHDRVSQRVR